MFLKFVLLVPKPNYFFPSEIKFYNLFKKSKSVRFYISFSSKSFVFSLNVGFKNSHIFFMQNVFRMEFSYYIPLWKCLWEIDFKNNKKVKDKDTFLLIEWYFDEKCNDIFLKQLRCNFFLGGGRREMYTFEWQSWRKINNHTSISSYENFSSIIAFVEQSNRFYFIYRTALDRIIIIESNRATLPWYLYNYLITIKCLHFNSKRYTLQIYSCKSPGKQSLFDTCH